VSDLETAVAQPPDNPKPSLAEMTLDVADAETCRPSALSFQAQAVEDLHKISRRACSSPCISSLSGEFKALLIKESCPGMSSTWRMVPGMPLQIPPRAQLVGKPKCRR